MARVRPDPDFVLVDALRAALPDDVTVVNLRPDPFLDRLPLVQARTVSAPATQMLAHRTYADVDIQSWAATRRAASDLDDACLAALLAARGVAHSGGYISRIDVQSLGSELRVPDQPGQVFRWQAGYRLTIRPAA